MELKEAPPKIDQPTPERDGTDNIKVIIEAFTTVKPGMTVLPDLRKAFEEIGTPLLGATVMRRLCICGNCPGTIYGIILKRTEEAVSNVGMFFLVVGGMSIEDTNDPSLRVGSFDELADPTPTN